MGLFDFLKKEKSDVEKYYEERDRRDAQKASTYTSYNTETSSTFQNTDAEYANMSNLYTGGSGFYMEIEDVFFITGRGVVVTGHVSSGSLKVGENVILEKSNGRRRELLVTGIEKFRKILDAAVEGDNVGLLLKGIQRNEIERGDCLMKEI